MEIPISSNPLFLPSDVSGLVPVDYLHNTNRRYDLSHEQNTSISERSGLFPELATNVRQVSKKGHEKQHKRQSHQRLPSDKVPHKTRCDTHFEEWQPKLKNPIMQL